MVPSGDLSTHQPARDESPVPRPAVVQKPGHRPPSDCHVRQLNGGRLRQQAGGHSLQRPLLIDRATSPMDGDQGHPAGSEVPARPSQHPSGPAQPPQPSPGCGMVTPSSGSERSTAQVGFPHPGPVRNTPQRQAAAVLLPDSGPSGSPRGRLPPPLEQPREGSGAGQRPQISR